jgi:ankyrin repeat protein
MTEKNARHRAAAAATTASSSINDYDKFDDGTNNSLPQQRRRRSRSTGRHRSQQSIGDGSIGLDDRTGGSRTASSSEHSQQQQQQQPQLIRTNHHDGLYKRRSATLTNSYDDLIGIASAVDQVEHPRVDQQQWGGGLELRRSQSRVNNENDFQLKQQQQQQQVESLRDYWRKRAEESKERIVSATTANNLPTSVLGGSVGSSVGSGSKLGEKAIEEDDSSTRGSGSRSSVGGAGGGSRVVNPPPPPPPPKRRQSGNLQGSSIASSNSNAHHRARSKSRGRSDHGDRSGGGGGGSGGDMAGSGTTESSPTHRHHHHHRNHQHNQPQQQPPQSPRKVDSIASALIGHSLKNSTVPQPSSSLSSDSPYLSRPQESYTSQRQNLSSNSASTRDSNDKRTRTMQHSADEDQYLLSLSPLHHSLATSSWPMLHAHIRSLSTVLTNSNHEVIVASQSEIASALSVPHPRLGGTVLHVASWKAPPTLAARMIRLLPRGSREMAVLLGMKDGEGNTPLHLCAGNLDYRVEESIATAENKGEVDNERHRCGVNPLALLKEIMKSAPVNAWMVQNSEGDTPLHMLVSSPLCTSNWRGLTSPALHENEDIRSKLAQEAISLVLSTPDAVEACLLRENSASATPLHIALASGAHDCVIEALLSASPASVGSEDGRGMLPLHWAAAFGRASYVVVKKIIEQYPLGLTSATVDGDIPLHLAVSNSMMEDELRGFGGGVESGLGRIGSFSEEGDSSRREKNRLKIVELLMHDRRISSLKFRMSEARDSSSSSSSSLLETTTSPILTANREKLTPLHCCALFDAPPQISKLLMKHSDANVASSTTNSFGATPLHLAAAQPGVSQSIATVLAIGTPDAAAVQDRLKRTPLHVAAQNTYATNLLIKTLAELNPNAASVKTQRGHLPLHLAAQSQAKEAVIRALIKAYPAAAESRNKSNNTPLHDAAKYRASLGVVRLLLDAFPGALYVQNQYGNLPLHCATAYQAPSEVVQLLLKSWPEGASMQNRNQDAPLHYAAAYATSTASVRPLIEAAPAAVLLLNSSGQSPVDRAKANNAPKEIVRLLEHAAEDYSRNATSGEKSWASFGQGGANGGGGRLTSTQASF